jgi:hypothetical protein
MCPSQTRICFGSQNPSSGGTMHTGYDDMAKIGAEILNGSFKGEVKSAILH